MEFLFLGLALGCLAFLFKILADYFREVPVLRSKTEKAEAERDQHEAQLDGQTQAKKDVAGQAETIGEEIKTLESMRTELKAEIEKVKKEMARKGRIIMNRSSKSS